MAQERLTCSCVVVNYNDSKTTSLLLNRISHFNVFNAIIVVDNCSVDDSYEDLLKLENDKIRVFKSPQNGGYGFGNNYGVRLATQKYHSKYVLIVNPDVIFSEDTVVALLNSMRENIAVSSCVQLDKNHKKIESIAWRCPSFSQYVFSSLYLCSKLINMRIYREEEFKSNKKAFVDCVPGSLLLVDTAYFEKVGGFDEKMFLYCEESTLGKKLSRNNYKTVLLLNHYYIHNHSVSVNKTINSLVAQRRILYKSRLIYLKKYLRISKAKYWFAKAVFKISLFEERIKEYIKRKQ